MSKDRWSIFYNYEKALLVLLGITMVFTIVNEKTKLIPFEISGYFFWLTIGLYLGFRLAKREVIRVQKNAGGRKEEDLFSKN